MKKKTRKYIISLFTCFIACLLVYGISQQSRPLSVSAETGTYGVLSYDSLADGTLEITDCEESVVSVEIPAEIDGVAVTSIASMAFKDCKSLTSVTIPDGITNIGNEAFSWCSKLEEVTIPNSVTKIKDKVFYLCYNLKTVTLSENLESIGEGAFNSCSKIENIKIPNSVTDIGAWAFTIR